MERMNGDVLAGYAFEVEIFHDLQESGIKFEEITTLWTEKKRKNIAGLQIADLAAYPIARKILDPTGAQLSFDVLRAKICHKPGEPNCILGYGIKIFPQATFAHYLHLDGGI